jgi:hypothetical protein
LTPVVALGTQGRPLGSIAAATFNLKRIATRLDNK